MGDNYILTQGAILDFYSCDSLDKLSFRPILQIITIKKCSEQGSAATDKYKFLVSDGTHYTTALGMGPKINKLVCDGIVIKNTVVQIARSHKVIAHGKPVFLIIDVTFVSDMDEQLGSPQKVDDNMIRQAIANRNPAPPIITARPNAVKMSDNILTRGAIMDFYSRDSLHGYRPVLQIKAVLKRCRATGPYSNKYKFLVSDGTHYTTALAMGAKITKLVNEGIVMKKTVVRISKTNKTITNGRPVFVIRKLTFVCHMNEKLGSPQKVNANMIRQAIANRNPAPPIITARPDGNNSVNEKLGNPQNEDKIIREATADRNPARPTITSRTNGLLSTMPMPFSEEDRGIAACSQKLDVSLDVTEVSKSVVVYDLETGGLESDADILQIGGVRFNMETGEEEDVFNMYITPTGPICPQASYVNHLYNVDNGLCKKDSDGQMIQLKTSPCALVLESFVEWALKQSQNVDPSQVILVGYNNSRFDDHRLVRKFIKYLPPELVILVREKFFSSDVTKLLPERKKLSEVYLDCPGADMEIEQLHDAVADCRAVCLVIKSHKMDFGQLSGQTRTFDSVICAQGNPLLKSKMITKKVADRIPVMKISEFMELTDEEVKQLFSTCGLKTTSLNAALRKRERHRAMAQTYGLPLSEEWYMGAGSSPWNIKFIS